MKDCVPVRASGRVWRAAGWGLCTQPGPRVSAQVALLLSEMTRTTSAEKKSQAPPACWPATPLPHIGGGGGGSVRGPAEAHYNQERQASVWAAAEEEKIPLLSVQGVL